MVDIRQHQLTAQARRVELGLALLILLCGWLGLKQLVAGGAWLSVSLYALGVVLLGICFASSLRTVQDSVRQQGALASVLLALLVHNWWSLEQVHWYGLFVLCCFLVLSLWRALLFALICVLGFFVVVGGLYSWFKSLSLIVPVTLMALGLFVLFQQLYRSDETLGLSLSQDALTGCGNLQCLQKEMTRQAELSRRYQVPATALLVTVNDWQQVVQSLGERKASLWLKELVGVWLSRLRNTDTLCRYRDAEFVFLLPNTCAENAQRLADDLVRASQSYEFRSGVTPNISFYPHPFVEESGVDDWMNTLSQTRN